MYSTATFLTLSYRLGVFSPLEDLRYATTVYSFIHWNAQQFTFSEKVLPFFLLYLLSIWGSLSAEMFLIIF